MIPQGHETFHLYMKLLLHLFSCAQDLAHTVDTPFGCFPLVFAHSCPFSLASSDLFLFFLIILHVFFSPQLLNRKDKTTFEKLDYLMSKEDNYKRTREYIRSLKMVPSIPYLGRSLNRLPIF